jgi:molecular chaperone DnaK
MNEAAQRLEQASHRLAEAIYKGAASASSSSGASGAAGGEPAGGDRKEDDVIDTEYVDTDKT